MTTCSIGLRRASLSIAGLLTVSSACTAFYPARPADVALASTVAVTFDEPRNLEATRDSIVYALPAVRAVRGQLERVQSDTLVLLVRSLESNQRQPRLPNAARVTIVTDTTARVSVQRGSPGRTLALVGGTVGALLALAAAADPIP